MVNLSGYLLFASVFSYRRREFKNPQDEVNDYLARAIDARSIDRLRDEHCRPFTNSFHKGDYEEKVNTISLYFVTF